MSDETPLPRKPVSEIARLMAIACDLHSQGERSKALGVWDSVVAALAAKAAPSKRDMFIAACAAGIVTAGGMPQNEDAADTMATAAVELADALVVTSGQG
jgi:hypothetical protein